MKARVLKQFFDNKENTMRRVGDEFECTKERFTTITNALGGFVEEVIEVADVEEEKPKARPKKSTK